MFERLRDSIASLRALVAREPALPFVLRRVGDPQADAKGAAPQSIAFVSGGTALVSADADEPRVRVWRATDGRCARVIDVGAGRLNAVAPSSDGRVCVTVSDGSPWTLRVWDLESGACRAVVPGPRAERFMHLVLDRSGQRAITLSYEQPLMDPDCKAWSIGVVELASGGARTIAAMRETYAVGSAAIHPDGRRAFIGLDGVVEIWDLIEGAHASTLEGGGWSPSLVLDAAGERCIEGTREGRVVVWDVTTGKRARELQVGSAYASVKLLPGERRCVTLGHSRPPCVWDLDTGALVREVGSAPRFPADVAFDASGALLVAKRGDDALDVWSVETGAHLARARLGARATALAIARDDTGAVRVAVGLDRGLRFFEMVAS